MAEYIEREAVMQKFADHVRRSNNSDFAPAPTWNEAVQIVEDFPAADVRPVVRWRWMKRRFSDNCVGYECLNCHTTWDAPTNFCPNCGAMMEKS